MKKDWMKKRAVVTSLLFTLLAFLCSECTASETSTTELRRHVREQLIEHANATDDETKEQAAISLCDLYVILRADPRFESSDMLKGDAAKVRRRLLSVMNQRQRQLKRDGIKRPKNLDKDLDQIMSKMSRKSMGSNSGGGSDDRGDASSTGGGSSANGGGRIVDSGWGLVELIKRVIDPNSWSDRGGTGTIQYFAMSRALVIRATTDHHQEIRDLLNALR